MRRPLFVVLAVVAMGILLIYAFAPILASHDLRRLAQDREPTFARLSCILSDGGTTVYAGPGYELKAKHRIVGDSQPIRYDTGVALSFSIPFYKRFDYATTVESDH